jgi:[ribosomal protein S18]-alanine N-acetyltransferase
MLLRPATADDIPFLMNLERSAASAAHWSNDEYERLFQNSPQRLVLLLEEETQVAGFLVARCAGPEWELENVIVAEGFRRRGFASRLLAGFLDHVGATSGSAVFLEVRESNLAARGLYEKSGFLPSGHRVGYYHQPDEDAIIYRLSAP